MQEVSDRYFRRMTRRNPAPECAFGSTDPRGSLSNGFFACKPQSYIVRAAIRHLRTFNLYYDPSYLTVMVATGAIVLTLSAADSNIYLLTKPETRGRVH